MLETMNGCSRSLSNLPNLRITVTHGRSVEVPELLKRKKRETSERVVCLKDCSEHEEYGERRCDRVQEVKDQEVEAGKRRTRF